MNALLEISGKIESTNEALSRLGRMLKERPNSPGLLANMRTLERTHRELEEEFAFIANRLGLEVCTYRLITNMLDQRRIFALGRALVNFQNLFSVIFDAVKYGEPKATAHLHEGVWDDTQFDFAYSYSGSIGIAMTVSPQVNLYENPFDNAIRTIFDMAKVQTSDEMKEYSRALGVAPVKALYTWADELAQAEFGVDVTWKALDKRDIRILIEKSELMSLRETISSMSEEKHSELEIDGTLIAANVLKKTFGFQYIEGDQSVVINGRFADAIDSSHAATVPAMYRAHIRKTTRTKYSTAEDKVEYFLLRLEDFE